MSSDRSSDTRTPQQIAAVEIAVGRLLAVLQETKAELSPESIARAAIDYYMLEIR